VTWRLDDVIVPGTAYRVVFDLEHDGDDRCSTGDHGWFEDIGSFRDDAVVELGHPFRDYDDGICAYL